MTDSSPPNEMLSSNGSGVSSSASDNERPSGKVAELPRIVTTTRQFRNRADHRDDDATSAEMVLKIDGVTGPVFARPLEHDEYDYEAVYTGASLTEYEGASTIESLLAARGGEQIPIDESPFAGDGPDTEVTGRGFDG